MTSRQDIVLENYQKNGVVVRDLFKRFAMIFNDFYLGVETYQKDDNFTAFIREFGAKFNYELLAFPHLKYVHKDDAINLQLATE